MTLLKMHSSCARQVLPLALAALLLGWTTAGMAEIYKWVNENNEVQYTQTPPPPGVKAAQIHTSPPPTGADESAEKLQQQIEASEQQQEEKREQAVQSSQEKEYEAIRKQNCVTARNNLTQLNQSSNTRYKNEAGEIVRMTDEDRAARIEQARQHIEEYCEK